MTRSNYRVLQEPRGNTYRRLIDYSLRYCHSFLLVVGPSIPINETGRRVLTSLEPFLLSQTESSEWPGTRLLDGVARVYRFTLSSESATILAQVADSLFSWVQPNLPEDLCLNRCDGSPFLVTISHEKDAYLQLTPEEASVLIAGVPGLEVSREEVQY